MAELSENKKYMNLDGFRLSYRKKDDTIHLTSTDKAFASEGFHLTLKDGSPTELALRSLLTENGIIAEDVVEKWLASNVNAMPPKKTTWDKIPLGVTMEGPLLWDVNTESHALLSGSTGSGKSVLQKNIFLHLAKHKNDWRFMGIDLKNVELSYLNRLKPEIVLSMSYSLLSSVVLLEEATTIMDERYALMEDQGVYRLKDLKKNLNKKDKNNSFQSIMIMIDEAALLFKPTGNVKDDALRAEAHQLAFNISCLGRAAGIHFVIASQEPADAYMRSSLKANMGVRVAIGRHSATNSALILGNNEATKIDNRMRGRAIAIVNGAMHKIQIPFQK